MYGKIIRKLRKEKKMTQKELSEMCGFESSSAIAMVERGERKPSIETLEKLSTIFEVSIDYLLGKTEEVYPGEIDDLEDEYKVLYRKYEKMTKDDRTRLLKMIDLFDTGNHDTD